jgi:hypothetical protein
VNKTRKLASFWDKEFNQLIRRRKAALFKLKEFPSRENVLLYKKKEAMAKSGLRKIKKEYFKKFCNSINTQRKLANLRICGIAKHNQI